MSAPWSQSAEHVLEDLRTDAASGLTAEDAGSRLLKNGPNRLSVPIRITFLSVLWDEVREPMILLLLVVGVVYAIWGELRDTITIFTVILLLVLAEVFTEYRAKSAISALRKLTPGTTPVLRDGKYLKIPAEQIVTGDIVPLDAGDRIAADARLIESFGLQVDESALTGESTPGEKENILIAENSPVTDRANMVFAGTAVTSGTGKVVVTATAMDTEIGKIHGLVQEAKQPRTPLQLAMKELSGLLVWAAVFFSVVIPFIGVLQGKSYKDMILTALSLAFAVIPEELPIIITMVLGLGALALSRRNVLIRNLRAAETLGSVTSIVTDKTGTITENKMTVSRLAADGTVTGFPPDSLSSADLLLLEAGALASTIRKGPGGEFTGDPLEVALLEASVKASISPDKLQSDHPRIQAYAFDSRRKIMSVIVRRAEGRVVYAKGAPEVILALCNRISNNSLEKDKTPEDDRRIAAGVQEMAEAGMRVVALAYKDAGESVLKQGEIESNLVFLGIIGMYDPPRRDVSAALAATRKAGIRTIMVTGDLPLTAQKIAGAVGIDQSGKYRTGMQIAAEAPDQLRADVKDVSIFARINSSQKLDIVRALQANGEVVAVTGDGINDAPALKSADIGIAMGEKGTEAAVEAAGMVLTDDSYKSIVTGVREGRRIYDNLSKGVLYYMSVKIGLVLCFIIPLALQVPFPFEPIQIILLELLMDLAASATFVAEPIESDVMDRPPRDPKRRFIDRSVLISMLLASLSLATAVLVNYLVAYYGGKDLVEARTIAFGTWLIGHIYLAFTMRSQRQTLFKLGIITNPVMLIWAAAAVCLLLAITGFSALHPLIRVTSLNWMDWLMILVTPFITVFWHEIKKAVATRFFATAKSG